MEGGFGGTFIPPWPSYVKETARPGLISPSRSPAKRVTHEVQNGGQLGIAIRANSHCSERFSRLLAELVHVHEEEVQESGPTMKPSYTNNSRARDPGRSELSGKISASSGRASPTRLGSPVTRSPVTTHHLHPLEAFNEFIMENRGPPSGDKVAQPGPTPPEVPYTRASTPVPVLELSVLNGTTQPAVKSKGVVQHVQEDADRAQSRDSLRPSLQDSSQWPPAPSPSRQGSSGYGASRQGSSANASSRQNSMHSRQRPPNAVERWEILTYGLLAHPAGMDESHFLTEMRGGCMYALDLQPHWRATMDERTMALACIKWDQVNTATSTCEDLSSVDLPDTLPDDDYHMEQGWLQRFVMHPTSTRVAFVAIMAWMLWMWVATMNPLFLVSHEHNITHVLAVSRPIQVLLWTIDIAFKFATGFEHKLCTEMRPGFVAAHYMRTWFVPDLLVLFIDVALMCYTTISHTHRDATMRRVLASLSLLHLLRVHRVKDAVTFVLGRMTTETHRLAFKFVILIGQIFMLAHYIACAWYALGSRDTACTWIKVHLVEADQSNFESAYIASLHWSLTQFTPSTNLIGPSNAVERVFAVLVCASALVIFTCFISHLTALFNQMRSLTMHERLQAQRMRQYIQNRNISNGLSWRIQHFMHKQRNGQLVHLDLLEDDVPVFQAMPQRLKTMLRTELYFKYVHRVLIFKAFRKQLHLPAQLAVFACREAFYKPLEEAFHSGQEATDLFMLASGTMRYHLDAGVMSHGDALLDEESQTWIAEYALSLRWIHVGTLSGAGSARLVLLDVKSTLDHMASNLQIAGLMRTYSIYLMQHLEAVRSTGEIITDFSPGPSTVDFLLSKSTRTMSLRQTVLSSVALGQPGTHSGVTGGSSLGRFPSMP